MYVILNNVTSWEYLTVSLYEVWKKKISLTRQTTSVMNRHCLARTLFDGSFLRETRIRKLQICPSDGYQLSSWSQIFNIKSWRFSTINRTRKGYFVHLSCTFAYNFGTAWHFQNLIVSNEKCRKCYPNLIKFVLKTVFTRKKKIYELYWFSIDFFFWKSQWSRPWWTIKGCFRSLKIRKNFSTNFFSYILS